MKKVNLVNALEKGIDKLQPVHEWNNDNIHVSDLAVFLSDSDRKCHRSLWMRLRGYKKKKYLPGKKLMFLQGNRLHEIAAELLKYGLKDWYISATEYNVSDGLPDGVTGRTDLILSRGNELMIVDFKTVRGGAFGYLNEPKESHKLQVRTYMYATGADYGAVLYIDREGQNFARQFPIEKDNFMVEAAIKKAKVIAEQKIMPEKMSPKIKTRKNKGPDAVYAELPWQCKYCDYLDVSCKGALPFEFRGNTVKGYLEGDDFKAKEDYHGIGDYITLKSG